MAFSNLFTSIRKICTKTDVIIIKDIDANHKFGNFMNRVHDKIINGETIYDIYPEKIIHYMATVMEIKN